MILFISSTEIYNELNLFCQMMKCQKHLLRYLSEQRFIYNLYYSIFVQYILPCLQILFSVETETIQINNSLSSFLSCHLTLPNSTQFHIYVLVKLLGVCVCHFSVHIRKYSLLSEYHQILEYERNLK